MHNHSFDDRTSHSDSDELAQLQMHVARAQGEAYGGALELLASSLAFNAGEQRAEGYWIGYTLEPARGTYEWIERELAWREPDEGNVYVGISVRDAADGRFVPAVRVVVTLTDPAGHQAGPHEQPLLWDPTIYHYGRNWSVPTDGEYGIRVRVEPPRFGRRDHVNGSRFTAPVEMEFAAVSISRPS